ncbi:MAG: Rpn family recombination-promoting nuclease/putative transposase [Methylococcales bacterium]|nr:Rpn family recombination-promoting nuclease/putative transposase [Methylococcales bacterium]
MKFADPTNDIAFKKIFGDQNKKEILISFLNAILGFEGQHVITNILIVNPYQVPKIEALKETILDIKATNQAGENFIIEMQKKDLGNFAKRTLYYTSKAYVQQLNKGDNYSKLKKVYFIGLLKFDMFSSKNYISRHLILNTETCLQDLDDFEFTFLELTKFNKPLNELNSLLDKWIYFLKHASDLSIIPKELENIPEIEEAFQIATQYGWNQQELEVYDYIGLKEYDEINAIQTAEKKALKKGIEQGIEQGKYNNNIKIAIKMLNNKMDIDLIMKITELPEKIIVDLKIKHKQ